MKRFVLRSWRPRRALAVAVASVAVAAVTGAGAQAAPAASPQIPAATSIAIIAGSTQLAVSHLQHTPNFIRRAAAQAIIDEARLLIGTRRGGNMATLAALVTNPATATPSQVATLAAVAPPGTVVGGLVLDAYCRNLGFDHSAVNGPIVAPSAAFKWFCVATSGAQTPIIMQSACIAQYPGQVTIAFPQDVNDAYSWVCIVPAAGHFTDPGSNTTVDTVTTPNSGATLIVSPTGSFVTFDQNGTGGSVDVNGDGSGFLSWCNGCGTLPVLTFEGGGSTLPV